MFWNFERPEKWRRTFHILDDERLDVDDDVIDVGNGDVIDVSNGDIFAVITVPPNSHFLPISDLHHHHQRATRVPLHHPKTLATIKL